jgi:hypothetical protein
MLFVRGGGVGGCSDPKRLVVLPTPLLRISLKILDVCDVSFACSVSGIFILMTALSPLGLFVGLPASPSAFRLFESADACVVVPFV